MSYLSLSAAASKESSAASRNGSRSPLDQNGSDSPNSESRLPTRLDPASDLINAASAPESLTPTAVLTLARSILAGSHAVPTRLKILLDRAFDRLSSEERNIILTACSWNYEDYLRGYKLKVNIFYFPLIYLCIFSGGGRERTIGIIKKVLSNHLEI